MVKILLFKVPEIIVNYKKYLNNYDKQYLNKFKGVLGIKKYYGLLLQKLIIKLNYDIDTKNIIIKRDKYGKPFFDDKIYFNTSYSKFYIIIAYSFYKIGIDIEDEKDVSHILKRYGNFEKENIKIWTKIESYLKFDGYGLSKMNDLLIENDKIINKYDDTYFKQIDISHRLPEKIFGTITTSCDFDIYFYELKLNLLLDILDKI